MDDSTLTASLLAHQTNRLSLLTLVAYPCPPGIVSKPAIPCTTYTSYNDSAALKH
jgi:hypothetical protein